MSYSKIITFFFVVSLGLTGCSRAQTQSPAYPAPSPAISQAKTAPKPLAPGSNDGTVAYITARLLEEFHYSQQPFDTEISEKFYDAYLDAYDPQHLYFLQSDVDEFSHYRTNLDVLTLGSHGQADVTPAYKIFNRFLERLQERVTYADDLLKRDNFKFNSDEQVQVNRKDAPYPKNMDEAKRLWRQELLRDFLVEKLDREDAPGAKLSATNLAEITGTLKVRYERELRACKEFDSADVLQYYLDSLAHAYDPHSDYLNEEHAQDFAINMSLALFGIGAELTMSDDGYCQIESLVPGGPAAKSNKLNPNDKIIAVAQGKHAPVDVVNMELGNIVQLIRGAKGTEVRLTIIPADDPQSRRVVTLTRAEIKLEDQEAKAMLIETPNGNGGTNRLGIIDVPSFYAPVDSNGKGPQSTNYVSIDVAKLVKKLTDEKVGGIILDLRRNPGGSLEEAVNFVGLFVTNGPVVQIRSPENADVEDVNDHSPDIYQGPLIVLIDRLSASASEIVAAALQDYGRALIVGGKSSFGKGTVQNLDPLRPFVWAEGDSASKNPGMVKITIRKFYRINGASTQLKGVIPDIILPDVLSYSDEIGESSLPNALPWDTIPATNYVKMDCVQPYLKALQQDSEARVATNQDFSYVRQDIAELEKLQSEKTDTINERKAWDEKEEMNAHQKAREVEIASRKLPKETIYDISLADADKPGLPAPVVLVKPAPPVAEVKLNLSSAPSIMAHEPPAALNAVVPHAVSQTTSTNSISGNGPEKTIWEPNAMLDESERIMEDYILLQQSGSNTIASHE